jgi:hypothetical protein
LAFSTIKETSRLNPHRLSKKIRREATYPKAAGSARERRIRKAMRHKDSLGAGAKARRKYLRTQDEVEDAVRREYARKTLWSGSGHKVTSSSQAEAIAKSEAARYADRGYVSRMSTEALRGALKRPHRYKR